MTSLSFVRTLALVCACSLAGGTALAQAPTPTPTPRPTIESLNERVLRLEEELARHESGVEEQNAEVTKIKLEMQLPETLGPRFTGLGPALSKTYFSKTPFSFASIGDINFRATESGSKSTDVDHLDAIFGYKFSRRWIAQVALGFPSGGVVKGSGTADVEFAYIDFLINEDSGIRAGNLLVPVGITNLRFEPTLFPTVRRPLAERTIIPTTWHENGLIAFSHIGNVVIQGGFVNGLDASGFTAANWLRGGRQNGANASAQNTAFVARAEWLEGESSAGLSGYFGDSNEGNSALGSATVALGEMHAEVSLGRLSGRALYTEGTLSDTDRIRTVTGQSVGKRARGTEFVLSYDLLPRISPIARVFVGRPAPPDWKELPLFVAFESSDPQLEAGDGGGTKDDHLHSDTLSVGFNYQPHPQVIIKGDLASSTDGAGTTTRTYETSIGFIF